MCGADEASEFVQRLQRYSGGQLERFANGLGVRQVIRTDTIEHMARDIVLVELQHHGNLNRIKAILEKEEPEGVLLIARDAADEDFVWWSADFLPENAADRLWSASPSIREFAIDLPYSSHRLCGAILRLLYHAKQMNCVARKSDSWQRGLNALENYRTFHTYKTDESPSIKEMSDTLYSGKKYSSDKLTELLEAGMDKWCIKEIGDEIYSTFALGGRYAYLSTRDDTLKTEIINEWKKWRKEIYVNSDKRTRFLRLLLSPYDGETTSVESCGFSLGKMAKDDMVGVTVFALAVAVCHPDSWIPKLSAPGNLSYDAGSAHACGVRWVCGKPISVWLNDAKYRHESAMIILPFAGPPSKYNGSNLIGKGDTMPPTLKICRTDDFEHAFWSGLFELKKYINTVINEHYVNYATIMENIRNQEKIT